MIMASVVYILCAMTSLTIMYLLALSYRESRNRLSFWTSIAFGFFSINNIFLILDFVIFLQPDLSLFRTAPLFIGVIVLVYGLVEETV
jgi:hypothetical protein